jgi:hypothetical protein
MRSTPLARRRSPARPVRRTHTGGTGDYRNIGLDGTLVQFGNGKGHLTLRIEPAPDRH